VIVTIPEDAKGARPAVVCIHGHGGDRTSTYDKASPYKGFATELAERGVVTIAANVGQHEVYEPDERILMGERLWDLMRCVDYLETLPEVDKGRIGCAGLSLGGEMAMWLGAMDTRIQTTVSSGFLTVMDQMEQNHCICWKFDGLRELVDFADIFFAHRSPRAPVRTANRREKLSSTLRSLEAMRRFNRFTPSGRRRKSNSWFTRRARDRSAEPARLFRKAFGNLERDSPLWPGRETPHNGA
jgi:hypothetical protein